MEAVDRNCEEMRWKGTGESLVSVLHIADLVRTQRSAGKTPGSTCVQSPSTRRYTLMEATDHR
jgi:hypothetical protein